MNQLSRLLTTLSLAAREQHLVQLLELNERTAQFGLTLAPDDVRQLMAARSETLRHYGRLETGIEATKELIEAFAESPFINRDNYVSALHELQELFYHLKNETEDEIGDSRLIEIMRDCFDRECGGSLELLRDKMEEYAAAYRFEAMRERLDEGEDDE
jgi:hypothetical protein